MRKVRRTKEEVGRSIRKQSLTVKIRPEVWLKLDTIREMYNCKSLYMVMEGLLELFCKHMDVLNMRKEQRKQQQKAVGIMPVDMPQEYDDLHDEIDAMFREFSDAESPRYGERTKRGHNKWDTFGDSVSIEEYMKQYEETKEED